ncbi:MAG: hypothetical protein JJU22_18990, partial [Gammaproteobacteria bacterium]|nr:hypothetical protein [Gammaproteobacteria bacterium]
MSNLGQIISSEGVLGAHFVWNEMRRTKCADLKAFGEVRGVSFGGSHRDRSSAALRNFPQSRLRATLWESAISHSEMR